MIGALVRDFVRRHLPLVIGGSIVAALVVWSGAVWPLVVWAPVWSLVLVGAWVLAALFDTGDGGR